MCWGDVFNLCIYHNVTKGNYAEILGAGAPVYLAAVMEYLATEVLELAGNAAHDKKKIRIIPKYLLLAICHDEELNKLLSSVTITQSSVLLTSRLYSSPRSTDSPALTEWSESSEPTSESLKSTSSSLEDDTDTGSTSSDDMQSTTSKMSTASNRTLRHRVPIIYNKTLLKCLHGSPQIRTLHNVSLPFSDSSDEETKETDEHRRRHKHTQEDTHEHTNMNVTSEWTVLKHRKC